MDIKKIRNTIGMTLQEFGTEIGVSFYTVHRWEKGTHQPSPLAMQRVKKLLKKRGFKPSDFENGAQNEQ